jgi:hypothetical protein
VGWYYHLAFVGASYGAFWPNGKRDEKICIHSSSRTGSEKEKSPIQCDLFVFNCNVDIIKVPNAH